MKALVSGLVLLGSGPALAAAAPSSLLKDPNLVVARAVGVFPDRQLVEWVAEKAETTTYLPGPAPPTVKMIIEQKCGSVQPGYVEKVRRLPDQSGLSLDQLADRKVELPACLWATRKEAATNITVQAGDTKTGIAQKMVGFGLLNPKVLKSLFGSAEPVLKAGDEVKVSFASAPTFLKLKSAPDIFLEKAASTTGISAEAAKPAGAIIGPSDKACNGSAPHYPFDKKLMKAAFATTLDADIPEKVTVAVIDNGFWGVPCDWPLACPRTDGQGGLSFVEPFRRDYFDTRTAWLGGGEIGPKTADGGWPINWRNKLGSPPTIDSVSAHGTHVLGLLIGGSALEMADRSIFERNGSSWLRLVVGNIAPGGLQFPVGANERFFAMLSSDGVKAKIVNLSVAFDPSQAAFITQLVTSSTWRETLFVVAAGNSGEPLANAPTFPAGLGGQSMNVLTVASVDADDRLSSFSTHSDQFVDLAAPGCRLGSWLTSDGQSTPMSGTSQAAPMVSMAAAMLATLWPEAGPLQLKNRLIYSGALLATPIDRARVKSGRRLDIAAALMVRHDYIRYDLGDGGGEHVVIGSLDPVAGLTCANGAQPPWTTIRSFSRSADGAALLATRLKILLADCPATLADTVAGVPNRVLGSIAAKFDGSRFVPTAGNLDIPTSALRSFVLAEKGNGGL